MRKFHIVFLFILLVFISCKKDDEKNNLNQIPSCNISSPVNGAVFSQGDEVQIIAEVYDNDGYVAKVSFYLDSTEIYYSTVFPFIYKWNTDSTTIGDHEIKVIARDDAGAEASAKINVQVNEALASFSNYIIPIFNNSCNMSACHSSGGITPDLTAGNAYNSLINGGYINTTDPQNSELYSKINSGNMSAYATAADKALILKWIEQGAKNN